MNARFSISFLMVAVLQLLLTACSDIESQSSSVPLTISIGGISQSVSTSSRVNLNVAPGDRVGIQQLIDQVYPYPGKVTLDIFGDDAAGTTTITALEINRDYNDGQFTLDANNAILVTHNSFLLNVPTGYLLSFTITFYNASGYQYFQGTGTYDGISGAGGTTLAIPIRVAVDPLMPRITPPDVCVDTDGDTFCDIYEDLFVNQAGVPDIDGDGIINSLDTDSDGDGQLDNIEGDAASNDGFPRYIHANRAPTSVSAQLSTVAYVQSPPTPVTIVDPDVGDTHVLTVISQPANGTAWSSTGNELNYTPNPGYIGSDSFVIEVVDQGGLAVQGIAQVTVNPSNNIAPVAVDDGGRTLIRASLSNGGVQPTATSYWPTVNGNGRFVAFWSADTNLVAGDTNGVIDLFIRDTVANTTVRATVNDAGVEADAGETDIFQLHAAPISPDGRYVVFESRASNLDIFGYAGNPKSIYMHDRLEGVTTHLLGCEGGPDGDSYEPSMSADGNHIAFTSLATDPWPFCWTHTDANGVSDIYISSTTYGDTWASVDALGNPSNGASYTPSISDDGTWIAFASAANNLLAVGGPSDTNGLVDIYLKNMASGAVSRISVDSAGNEVNGASSQPSISANGNRIAFLSSATNLVAGDTNGVADVFVHDVQLGTTIRVSVNSAGGQANGASSAPRISKDGRFVVFESRASNLVAGDTNARWDIFIHDTVSGQTRRLSESGAGLQANGASDAPRLSQDGRHMAYVTTATNLVAGDTNGVADIVNMSISDTVTKPTVAVTTPNLIANDTDADGNPLFLLSFTNPANGTLVDNFNNTLDYTPSAGLVGLDNFSYTVTDNLGGEDIGWVWLASETANYPPSAVNDAATTTGLLGVTITVLANDFDLDNDAMSVLSITQPPAGWGTAILNANNTVTYNPPTTAPLGPPYTANFNYTIDDGGGITSTAQISVTVN